MKSTESRIKLGHPFVLPVVAIILLTLVGLVAYVAFSGETVGAADTRLVQVSVEGIKRTVPTRADTVGELLARLDITLKNDDRVEPGIETPIVEDNQHIIITRARPVALVEGDNRTIVNTAEASAREIATKAGLNLFHEDLVEFRQSQENITGGVVAEEIIVERSTPITASFYGTIASYRTRAKILQDFLKEKNIVLEPGVTTQPVELNTPITAGMLISVNSPGKQTLAITEPIKFKVEFKNDPTLPAGQSRVEQAGQDGEQAIIYELTFEAGQETGRRVLQTVITKEPVNEIRVRGTSAIGNFSVSSEKASLMASAGISSSDYGAADFIISHESGWRPGAISANNCLGLGQRCSSSGTNPLVRDCPSWQTDPVCQLRHFSAYSSRYGGWQGAYNAWQRQGWW